MVNPVISHAAPRQDSARFLSKVHAYGEAYARSSELSESRLLALPHHRRIRINDAIALEAAFLEEFAPLAVAETRRPGSTRRDFALVMQDQYPSLVDTLYQSRFEVLCDVGLRLMIHYGRVRPFQTTNALESLLRSTDIGPDIPAAWFRTPFPDVFIEFGETRDGAFTMRDPLSGEHRVEGVYLLSGLSAPLSGNGPLVRAFDIIIFGSPLGKSGVMDDCYTHMSIAIEDEEAPIIDLVDRTVRYHSARGEFLNAALFHPLVEHVAKILVYLGTKDARQETLREGSMAEARMATLKSPAKIAKARRQNYRCYDRVVVGPTVSPSAIPGAPHTASGIRPHVRRGHFRSQPYGPQHSLRRPCWIEPTLIGATSLGEVTAPDYLIT